MGGSGVFVTLLYVFEEGCAIELDVSKYQEGLSHVSGQKYGNALLQYRLAQNGV